MRVKDEYMNYCGIGIMGHKRDHNIGTLWRSAYILGASYIFTIGKKYKKQTSDVLKTWARIPLFHYEDFDDFRKHIPYDCRLVGVELDERSVPLADRLLEVMLSKSISSDSLSLGKTSFGLKLRNFLCLFLSSRIPANTSSCWPSKTF